MHQHKPRQEPAPARPVSCRVSSRAGRRRARRRRACGGAPHRNWLIAKSALFTACRPSLPMIPTPMSAAWPHARPARSARGCSLPGQGPGIPGAREPAARTGPWSAGARWRRRRSRAAVARNGQASQGTCGRRQPHAACCLQPLQSWLRQGQLVRAAGATASARDASRPVLGCPALDGAWGVRARLDHGHVVGAVADGEAARACARHLAARQPRQASHPPQHAAAPAWRPRPPRPLRLHAAGPAGCRLAGRCGGGGPLLLAPARGGAPGSACSAGTHAMQPPGPTAAPRHGG